MSFRRILTSWLGIVAASLAMAGCVANGGKIPTAPTRNVSGFFSLQQVNGALLPAVSANRPPNACQGFLDSGRLFLTVDPQTYELATSTHFDCSNGAGPRFPNDTETGTWTLDGGPETFTITFTPNGTSFHHLTTATINTTAVTIRLDAPHQDAGNPNFSVTTFWRKQ